LPALPEMDGSQSLRRADAAFVFGTMNRDMRHFALEN
jgi:hypothetical protein